MRKLLCVSLLALSALHANAATPISTKSGFYARAEGGCSIMSYSFVREKTGIMPAFGLATGYKFNDNFMMELNARYKSTSYSDDTNNKGSIHELLILLNGYYTFNTNSKFTPYLTAGFGPALYLNTESERPERSEKRLKARTKSSSFSLLAWNIGLGSKYQLTKDVDLDLSYKFIDVIPTFGVFSSHNISVGLIYNF